MRLRVLQALEPGINGVFRHVEGLCGFLLEQPKIDVALAYSSVRGSRSLDALVNSIEFRGGSVVDLKVGNQPSTSDGPSIVKLNRLIEQFRPHVVHAHSSKAGALVRSLCWIKGGPSSFYTPNAYFGLNRKGGALTSVFNCIEGVLGSVGWTVNVSECERRFAHNELGIQRSRTLTIPNGVECRVFCPPTPVEKAECRRRLGIPLNAWAVGTVGRYSYQKDPETLYHAVRAVLEKDSTIWFAHLGEGELFEAIDRMLKGTEWNKRIVRVPYDDSPADFYKALDAFVLASRYEGLPISAIEALSTGLPLILTKCPGNEDFAGQGLSSVYWSEVEHPAMLAKSIMDARTVGTDSTNHRAIALSTYDSGIVHQRILSAYYALTASQLGRVM